MRSLSNVWDTAYSQPRPLKYKEAILGVVFNRRPKVEKREVYSLGRINITPSSREQSSLSIASPQFADGSYGVIVSGLVSNDGLSENCTAKSLACSDPSALPETCPRNKCVIGKVSQEDGLWRYISARTFKSVVPGEISRPLEYYTKSRLKNNPSFYNQGLIIDAPATRAYDIVQPMDLKYRSEEKRAVAMKAFAKVCRYREACIQNYLVEPAGTELKLGILSHSYGFGPDWHKFIVDIIEDFFYDDQQGDTLLESYLDTLESLRNHILLKSAPRYKKSALSDRREDYARPTYFRLPETYRSFDENLITLNNVGARFLLPDTLETGTIVSNPRFTQSYEYLPRAITDPEERLALGADPLSEETLLTPADTGSWRLNQAELNPALTKWTTSGYDRFLADWKINLDQFYFKYLDPRTCDPLALDWIRQFFGFTDGLWDEGWEPEQKRAILLNSFGWYDELLADETTGYKTLKGEVCALYPTGESQSRWVLREEDENYNKIVWQNPYLSELVIEDGIAMYNPIDRLRINLANWRGLHATKGNLLNVLWWISLFNIAGCNPFNELEAKGDSDYLLSEPLVFKEDRPLDRLSLEYLWGIKTRFDANLSSELARPIVVSPAQACDLDTVMYVNNPLIAGHTQVQDETILVIPVSFKYSRFNRIWDRLSYIVENWSPAATKVRAQYLYPASDYVAAGDVFFEDTGACSPWFIDNFDWMDWDNGCPVDPNPLEDWFLDDLDYLDNTSLTS